MCFLRGKLYQPIKVKTHLKYIISRVKYTAVTNDHERLLLCIKPITKYIQIFQSHKLNMNKIQWLHR